jgi:Holliday junction resolvase RusA-like endonuclease
VTTQLLSFTVYGVAQPQGSARAFVVNGRAVVTSANKNLKGWRELISAEARAQMNGLPPYDGPIEVRASFYLPRPKSVKREYHTVRPDGDKLTRGLFDSLSSIVYRDDSQVFSHQVSKWYVNAEVPNPCVSVWVGGV